MARIMTADLVTHVGERARIAGWIHHQRHLANLSFLLLRDASGIELPPAIEAELKRRAGR